MYVYRASVALALILCSTVPPARGQDTHAPPTIPGLRAHVRIKSNPTPIGQPVWAQFLIENVSDESITLIVPGAEPDIPLPEIGLPLSHIFSGGSAPAIVLSSEAGRRFDHPVSYRPAKEAPIVIVGARSIVGAMVDLREYYPSLRGAGQFRLSWRPYAGAVSCENVLINVAPLKQAEIVTDEGRLTLRFFYDDAPQAVANFIELAKSGFYDNKTFHRLEPGYLLQGGCPRGDGTGIRLDGKRIPAEPNGRRHDKGSVSMALLDDDPDSASCQFFICNTRQKDWDGRYTVFAELVGEDSFTVLDRLMATPVDDLGRPLRSLYLRTVRIVDAPPEPFDGRSRP